MMNDVYHINIDVLKNRLPIPAFEIEQASVPEDRRCMVSPRGTVAIQYRESGQWRNLVSQYQPMREAILQTEDNMIAEAKIVFVLGEAGLYHVEAVLQRASDDARVMVMSNRPDYLKLAFSSRDLSNALSDERLVIVTSTDMEMLKSAIRGAVASDIYEIPTFCLVLHPLEAELQAAYIKEFQTALHWTYTSAMTNLSTTQFFEHWWSHNFVTNIPFLLSAHKTWELEGSWRHRPVVIVGAGPSLNKNLNTLNRLKGKALILCVDTAYRVLNKAGIEPDVVVTLDGSPMNAEHMQSCNYSGIPLLFDEYSHRDVTWGHTGPKIVLSNGMYHAHWWHRVLGTDWRASEIETGGSVATTAFSFAKLLDADPVILIGVDLSYPNGACYAGGALHENRTLDDIKPTRRLYEVQDIYGNQVYTTHDYLYYLKWLHLRAKASDRTYINATEGGAVREGFIIDTLASVADNHCRDTQPVREWVQGLRHRTKDLALANVVLRNMKRSKRELKAAAKYLQIMATETSAVVHQVANEQEPDESRERRLHKAKVHLNALKLALAFLDSHSFSTIYKDIKISEFRKQNRSEVNIQTSALHSGGQTLELVSELAQIARDSIEMHEEGIGRMEQFLAQEATYDDKPLQCV